MPMEQITTAWTRYVDILLLAGPHVSARQAEELTKVSHQLAKLHDAEAAEFRYRAAFWRDYQPPES